MIQAYPAREGKDAIQQQSMAEIVKETEQVKRYASQGKYDKAYSHFSAITHQCIQCHQDRLFPALEKPTPEKSEATQELDPEVKVSRVRII